MEKFSQESQTISHITGLGDCEGEFVAPILMSSICLQCNLPCEAHESPFITKGEK